MKKYLTDRWYHKLLASRVKNRNNNMKEKECNCLTVLDESEGSEFPSVFVRIRSKLEVASSRIGEKCGGS